jgi:hypothetical protein
MIGRHALRGTLLQALAGLILFCAGLSAQGTEEPLQITDLLLSNHTGTAFVISWRTNRPTTQNLVFYSKDRSNLDKVVADSTLVDKPSLIHYVQIKLLDVKATYYYKVRSDGLEFSISPSVVDSVVTFAQSFYPGFVLLYGQVVDKQTGDPLERVLARAFLKTIKQITGGVLVDSSMWFTVLTTKTGDFNYDVANFRRYNGGNPDYSPNRTWLQLKFLGNSQGEVRDSVLLTAPPTGQQNVGTYQLVDERKGPVNGLIRATSPVLANGRSASVVWVTVLDKTGKPIPNVTIALRASPSQGATFLQPQQATGADGRTWGLVYSQVAEQKLILALNATTTDSIPLDSTAVVNFVNPPGDISQDKTPPFIYFTTDYGSTEDNVGPYVIRSRVVDNFTVDVKLVWSKSGNVYTDTLTMSPAVNSDEFVSQIGGQPYNTVINYLVMARDSAGFKVSKPDSIVSNPFLLPYRFEILPPQNITVARMGITQTTDGLNTTNETLPVRIDTWVTTTVGVRSSMIKWRNVNLGSTFFDIPLNFFGAHYWGSIPAQPRGSRIEYFVQVVDSLGRVDADRRRAPLADLFDYEVLSPGPRAEITFTDTSRILGTQDVRKTRHAVIADLNGDRYPDVVTANYGETNSIYVYDRLSGRLKDVTAQALGTQFSEKTTCVAVADVDADDDLDLIFANEGQQSRLLLNNGLGGFDDVTARTFTPGGVTRMPQEQWNTTCVLAEDFNGDGAIDLFFANNGFGGEQNKLLYNDSLGVFRDVTSLYLMNPPADQSVWAIAGDVDGDGDVDIVVINRAQNHVVYINNGKGVFRRNEITAPSAAQARGGDLADVDGDGDLDLVVAQSDTQQKELFLNNGRGVFSRDTQGRLPAESDNTYGVKFFDANGDGYPDLYYVNYGQPNRLLLNDGRGFFSEAPAGVIPSWIGNSTSVAVGDFNQDNRPDLYVTQENRANVLLYSRTASFNEADLPSAFDLISPGDRDTINTPTTRFLWHASYSADSTDRTRYSFQLALDSLFTPGLMAAQYDNLTDTTLTVASLADNTRYWWRVTAVNRIGVPVSSRRINGFLLMESYKGGGPEFTLLLSRNPVFGGYLNLYIISSEALASGPDLQINLSPVPVTRIGQSDIWRAQYHARAGFLISVTGVNLAGRAGEYVNTFASVLASAGQRTVVAAPDGRAWITLGAGSASGDLQVLVQSHEPPRSEKIKSSAASLNIDGFGSPAALLEVDCYSFTPLSGSLEGEVTVSFKARRGEDADPTSAVCILENGAWKPLETFFDGQARVYSAVSRSLGAFALLSGAGTGIQTLPRAFSLSQNAPNPFNPSTRITYGVPESGAATPVNIRVYNLRGALVRTLVDRTHQPGTYAVEWNGREESGRELPSGVYFYRLSAGNTVITRKMVLLR